MNIIKYLAKRLGTILISVVAIITITYILLSIAPGNFFDIQRYSLAAQSTSMTQAQIIILQKAFEKKYGLDQPLWKQVLLYLKDASRFKFGKSFSKPNMEIEELIALKYPVTFSLIIMSITVAILIGIPLGIIAALKRNTIVDYITMGLSMTGQVIPSFVVAIFCVILFSVYLRWLPTFGWESPRHVVLPVIAVSLPAIASIARFMRASLVDTLNQNYIRTAYAKGGTERVVITKHALKNSLMPIVTILGPQIAFMMVGTIWIETLFRIPGIGQLFINAAWQRDYPLLVTSTFIMALTVMGMNLIVDIVYSFLDPRLKLK